jgi:hypothetical protein
VLVFAAQARENPTRGLTAGIIQKISAGRPVAIQGPVFNIFHSALIITCFALLSTRFRHFDPNKTNAYRDICSTTLQWITCLAYFSFPAIKHLSDISGAIFVASF